MKTEKILSIGMGIATLVLGIILAFGVLSYTIMAGIIAMTLGIIILVSVAWRKLFNKKLEKNDFVNGVLAGLGGVVTLTGIMMLINTTNPTLNLISGIIILLATPILFWAK